MEDKTYTYLKNEVANLQKDVPLSEYTTFKIGGPAKYFCTADNKEKIVNAVRSAQQAKVKTFILGGGSNLLVSDKGFGGLVIKMKGDDVKVKGRQIYAQAGVLFSQVVQLAVANSLTGVEWAAGIPAITVCGAVYGNAQAFGAKMSDIVHEVEVLDVRKNKILKLSGQKCKFSLKQSIFKQNKNLIILSVVLALQKADRQKIEDKIMENLKYRKSRHPMEFPSAGSVFVNPEIGGKVIPAGFLIESCGLKGKQIGQAQISEKHCNFIINLGRAKAKDVLKLINLAKQKVKKKFGINLETEIQIIA